MEKEPTKIIALRVTESLKAEIEKRAAAEDRTVTGYITRAIKEKMKEGNEK